MDDLSNPTPKSGRPIFAAFLIAVLLAVGISEVAAQNRTAPLAVDSSARAIQDSSARSPVAKRVCVSIFDGAGHKVRSRCERTLELAVIPFDTAGLVRGTYEVLIRSGNYQQLRTIEVGSPKSQIP
jgi:hypothetical protein